MRYKTVKILFMVFILVALAACGTGDKEEKSGGDKGKEETKTGDAPKEKLVIGTDAAYAPFENMEKGEIVGFDIDFIKAVGKEAGYEDVEVKNTGWEPLFQSVKNGDVDLGISAITITDKRKETHDFSVPYFEAKQMILVPEGSDIKEFNDLKGLTVGVQTGTTGDIKTEELLGEKSENIKKYETTPLAIMSLINGELDAVVADNGVISNYVVNNPDQPVVAISDNDSFEPEFYGVMAQQGNTELMEKINGAINTIIENGKYAEIYKSWFGEEPNIEILQAQQ